MRRGLDRAARRPLVGAAAVGVGLSLALVVVTLPVDAVAHARARRVGLATQGYGAWLADVGRSAAIGAAMTAAGAVALLAIVRRFPRRWWLGGTVLVVVVAAGYVFLAPVVLDPVFNRFTPLPPGPLRSDVLELARRAGVSVGQVFRVDASRRTSGANAYVVGLGRTKRVVLYDTLIDGFPRDQVRSVVAHELGHVRHRDVPRGLLWIAIVAPAATLLVQVLTEDLAGVGRRPTFAERARPTPAMLPALALALAVVSFAVEIAGNVLSREVEASADGFALRLTGDPGAFVGLQRRLAVQNLAEPDPPEALHVLFGTHPTAEQRIGFALAWARAH